jgi:hypothetical protein
MRFSNSVLCLSNSVMRFSNSILRLSKWVLYRVYCRYTIQHCNTGMLHCNIGIPYSLSIIGSIQGLFNKLCQKVKLNHFAFSWKRQLHSSPIIIVQSYKSTVDWMRIYFKSKLIAIQCVKSNLYSGKIDYLDLYN